LGLGFDDGVQYQEVFLILACFVSVNQLYSFNHLFYTDQNSNVIFEKAPTDIVDIYKKEIYASTE